MKNKGKLAIIFGIIGFFLGILFAPRKGEETRQLIMEKVDQLREHPLESIEEIYNRLLEKVDEFSFEDINDSEIKIEEDDIVISKTFDIGGKEE